MADAVKAHGTMNKISEAGSRLFPYFVTIPINVVEPPVAIGTEEARAV
jgi:hypothetical protein